MLSWLSQISFKNNEVPHFNDSTFGIALNYLIYLIIQKLNILRCLSLAIADIENIMVINMKLWSIMEV